MNAEDIINNLSELKKLSWDSPVIKVRIIKIRDIINSVYGEEFAEIFENSLSTKVYSFEREVNQRNFFNRIDNAIDLIREFEKPFGKIE
jgi:hypothetical protein